MLTATEKHWEGWAIMTEVKSFTQISQLKKKPAKSHFGVL